MKRRAFLKSTLLAALALSVHAKPYRGVRIVQTGTLFYTDKTFTVTGPWRFEYYTGIGPTDIGSLDFGQTGSIVMPLGSGFGFGGEEFTYERLLAAMITKTPQA